LAQSLGLEQLNEDSAVPGLNRNTAYSQEFSLPPLPVQCAIAATLSALDDKIANNRAINN
jgi:type I restriction enzyme S subunit